MNHKTYHLIALAALLFAGAASTACSTSSDNEIIDQTPAQPTNGKYTLTVNASKVADATTRALTLNGNTLNATWTAGDKVTVLKHVSNYINDPGSWRVWGQLEVGNVRNGGMTCSLTGEFDAGTLNEGDCLRLVYPGKDLTSGSAYWMDYTDQDGKLDTIAKKYDYCSTPAVLEKAVKVTAVNGTNITTSDATFTSNQAIVRFTLVDKDNNPICPLSFYISTEDKQIVTQEKITGELSEETRDNFLHIHLISQTNVVYVAVRGFSNLKIKLDAMKPKLTYSYTKSDVTFENGKYYDITVKMKQ